MPRYQHVLRMVAEWPWAVMPATLDAILEVLTLRAEGRTFTDEEIQARIGAARPSGGARNVGAVAVLPLYGVIAPRMNAMTQMSGGTSAQQFGAAFRQAIESPDVSAVVLDVDSPGGSVFGVEELAATIREARGTKPIIAVANTLAASAAYWIASQADELIASPSSQVGSIGVLAVHVDTSAAEERAGIKTSYIATSKFKAEAAPGTPLTAEAREMMQKLAGGYHRAFVADVARGRGVSRAAVEEGFGEGRVVAARDAVKAGMVDGIGTLDQVIARLAGGRKRVASAMAASDHIGIRAAQDMPSEMEPDEDGNCPDGYEMGEDGMCHLMPPMDDESARAERLAKYRLDVAARGL